MHLLAHHHHKEPAETRGSVMNWGWRYDLMVGVLDTFLLHGRLHKLRQRTIDLAQLQPGETVLDVGCGTGTLAMAAQQRVGTMGRISGIDPGEQQIARARSKAKRANLPIDLQIGVIEQLPFSDQLFDVVLSTFMMHHLPDDLKHQGLSEIARVLKPEGRLVIVDFKHSEEHRDQPAQHGAGEIGLQDLPALMKDAGFSQIESGEMQFPRLLGFSGAGFTLGRTKSMPGKESATE